MQTVQANSLESKVALVTGAARRVGAEIAKALHEAGMNIVLHYNVSEEAAVTLCSELNIKRENSAIAVHAELQEIENANILAQSAMKAWGRLDVLINNASRFYRTILGKVTDYAWEDLINCNLKAPFFLSQAVEPALKETRGCIVNITDTHAERPLKDYSIYCISKAGLLLMTKALAKELGPTVRVNAVAPGSVMWPEGDNMLSDEEKQNLIEHTVLQRQGHPSDIAKGVLFFIRDADYVSGQVLNIDGGRMLY